MCPCILERYPDARSQKRGKPEGENTGEQKGKEGGVQGQVDNEKRQHGKARDHRYAAVTGEGNNDPIEQGSIVAKTGDETPFECVQGGLILKGDEKGNEGNPCDPLQIERGERSGQHKA